MQPQVLRLRDSRPSPFRLSSPNTTASLTLNEIITWLWHCDDLTLWRAGEGPLAGPELEAPPEVCEERDHVELDGRVQVDDVLQGQVQEGGKARRAMAGHQLERGERLRHSCQTVA